MHTNMKRSMLMLLAVAGAIIMVWLPMNIIKTVPLSNRDASPGFGWSWDFAYERAIQEPFLTVDAQTASLQERPGKELILPLGEPISISGLRITFRGMTESGRIRLDTVITELDGDYAYPREFSRKEFQKGFTLFGLRFKLAHVNPNVLRLRPVPPSDS